MPLHPFLEELTWRNMIHDKIQGLDQQLKKEMTAAYIGFDPTSDAVHIGSLSTLMLLKHLQIAGHKPYILLGGATGRVGDPSGKSNERKLLSVEEVNKNIVAIKKQLSKILDFDSSENSAEIVNNYDWFKNYSLLPFLRDIGKHITVNYMMAKDSVKSRLESGLSFTEFSYQLIQGYDFLHLFKYHNVKLQMGGSDQWGNIVTGTELIRKTTGADAFALTAPLVTKSDGNKFGKSEEGNIWLDSEKTSPYKFYQFWLNTTDEDAIILIKRFTLLSKQEIFSIEKEHNKSPHLRLLQKALADDVTERIHGLFALDKAKKASSILFGKSTEPDLTALDERTFLQIFKGVPQILISKNDLFNASDLISLLSESVHYKIFKSKGEARRMLLGGGVFVNKIKVNQDTLIKNFALIQEKYLLVQKGKKNYFILKINSIHNG